MTEPIDEQEINEFTRCEKQFQETNNTDESNGDTDLESEEQGKKLLNEEKGNRQVEDERDDEAAQEEPDNQDEEKDDEGEDRKDLRQKHNPLRWWWKKSPCHFLTQR